MEYTVKMPTDEMRDFLMGEALCDVDDCGNHIIVSGDAEYIEHIIDLERRIFHPTPSIDELVASILKAYIHVHPDATKETINELENTFRKGFKA